MTLPTFQNLASESGSMADYDRLVTALAAWNAAWPSEAEHCIAHLKLKLCARRCGWTGTSDIDADAWAERRVASYHRLMSNLTPALVMIEAYERWDASNNTMQGA